MIEIFNSNNPGIHMSGNEYVTISCNSISVCDMWSLRLFNCFLWKQQQWLEKSNPVFLLNIVLFIFMCIGEKQNNRNVTIT